MRPYCDCEYCVQDRRQRAIGLLEQRSAHCTRFAGPPTMGANVLWLGVAIALSVASVAGFLAAWWVQ